MSGTIAILASLISNSSFLKQNKKLLIVMSVSLAVLVLLNDNLQVLYIYVEQNIQITKTFRFITRSQLENTTFSLFRLPRPSKWTKLMSKMRVC